MAFWGKLLGIGAAAVTAAAALKVAQKYEENKEQEAQRTFDAEGGEVAYEPEDDVFAEGAEEASDFEDNTAEAYPFASEQDAEAACAEGEDDMDVKDVLNDVAKAAGEVLDEAREKVEDAAEKAGVDTDSVSSALREAGSALAGAGKAMVNAGAAVAHKVASEAPGFIDKVKEQAPGFIDKVKEQAPGFIDKVKDQAEDLVDQVKNAVNGAGEEPQAPADETTAEAPDAPEADSAPEEPKE